MSEASADGIYALFYKRTCVYIGQSNDCLFRIGEHSKDKHKQFDDYRMFSLDRISKHKQYKMIKNRIEVSLITDINPKFNIAVNVFPNKNNPLKKKSVCIEYIENCIDCFIDYVNLCDQNGEELFENSFEDIFRKYDKRFTKICLCKECAYYYLNIEANKEILRGVHYNRYMSYCMSKMNSPQCGLLYPDDGCTKGFPTIKDKNYRFKQITDKQRSDVIHGK